DAAVRTALALALLEQGRGNEALTEAQEAARRAPPGDAQASYVVAAIYHELRRPADADAVLTDLLARQPDYAPALLLAGLVKLELRQPDEAAPLLDRVTARDPRSPWARLGRAVVQRMRGETEQARVTLEALARERPEWTLAQLEYADTLLALGQKDAA